MAIYKVRLAKRAERGLRKIRQGDPRAYRRIVEAIRALGKVSAPPKAEKLTNFDPPAWRVRVGEYRIVYEIYEHELLVLVVNIAPRGEVYK
ncbi:MAG: type II toxin-antitoxin system RelE family toxin [Actinomycetota bacterium]